MKSSATTSRQNHDTRRLPKPNPQQTKGQGLTVAPPGTPSRPLEDNRPEAIAQRKLRDIAHQSQQVRDAAQWQHIADNRVAPAQLVAIGHDNRQRDPASEVVQRMAVMAVDDLSLQKDALVWNNLDFAVTKAPGKIGDMRTKKVWDTLSDKEEIRIVEHGTPGTLGQNYDAAAIIDSMTKGSNVLPKGTTIGAITFQSCFSGFDGGSGSLAAAMKSELATLGIKGVPITGRTGVAFGFEGMTSEETAETSSAPYTWQNTAAENLYNLTLLPDKFLGPQKGVKAYCEAMYELKDATTKISGVKIFKSPFAFTGYQKPWTLIGQSEVDWNKLDPAARAAAVSKEMVDYWTALQQKMTSYGGFKAPKDAIVTEIAAV